MEKRRITATIDVQTYDNGWVVKWVDSADAQYSAQVVEGDNNRLEQRVGKLLSYYMDKICAEKIRIEVEVTDEGNDND